MISLLQPLFGRLRTRKPAWIGVDELQRRVAAGDTFVLIDVRQPEEFIAPPVHLPGAVNVPLAELGGRTRQLVDDQQPVIVVCKTDRRSARAVAALLAAGLRDVAVLQGGTDEWHRQGIPLE